MHLTILLRARVMAGLCLMAGMLAAPTDARALPVFGELFVTAGGVAVSSTGLDFTVKTTTGEFAGLDGTLANTADLLFGSPKTNFISFLAHPTIDIDASLVAGGFSSAGCGAAAATGQTCTPVGALSGLSFVNTSTGATASFTVEGTLADGTGTTRSVTGVYTMQLADTTYQEVLATLSGGGTVRSTYSAEFATPFGDRFTIGGSLSLSSTGIDFDPMARVGAVSNEFFVEQTSTGSFDFAELGPGTFVDLSFATTPPGDTVDVPFFPSLTLVPSLFSTLTTLLEGVFPGVDCLSAPAAGQTCTPGGALSAYTFFNVPGGSALVIDVLGKFSDGFDVSPYVGLLTMQSAGLSYQQVLELLSSGQSATAMYSAAFAAPASLSPVPEPAMLVLLGSGIIVSRWKGVARGRRQEA